MAIRSRAARERERRRKAKKNRSQLLGATQQGQKRPMQQGYTTTKVEPPKFREPSAGADIMQAGQAYKGAKGLHEFAMGKEAYTDAAGNVVPARAPWTISDKPIFGEEGSLSNYFKGVGDRVTNTGRDLGNLFDTQPSPSDVGFNRGLLGPTPQVRGLDDPRAMNIVDSRRISGMPTTGLNAMPAGGDLSGTMLSGWGGPDPTGVGMSMGTPDIKGIMDAGGFGKVGLGGQVYGGADLSNLASGTGGMQGANAGMGFGAGGESIGGQPFGSSLNQAGQATGSIQAGTSTAGSGLQGASGSTPWLSYANIGKDLIMGGPQSQKITGSTAGDAALRAAAAYYTAGLSEIPYAFF